MKYRFLPFIFLIIGCSTNVKNDELSSPITINIEEALGRNGKISASDFIESFEYIPLEYSEKTLIRALGKPRTINDTSILVIGFRRISLFNRNTGAYIKDIGHFGNDPDGYRNTIYDLVYNAENHSVYANGWRPEYLEYSIESGEIIDKIVKPSNETIVDLNTEIYVSAIAKLSPNIYVGYQSNSRGDQPYRLIVFNKSGEILKLFKNHQSFEYTGRIVFDGKEGQFHHYNDQVFFKEKFNDTLFIVNQDTLKAQYIFELGDKSPPYAQKAALDYKADIPNFAFLTSFIETDKALIFTVTYKKKDRIAVYYRERKETMISNFDTGYELANGMINDVDGFIPFYPKEIQGDYLLGLTTAEDVSIWFENNPDKIASLPASLQVLKDTDPEGNPIIMIGKLK